MREENEALRKKLEAAGIDVSGTPKPNAPKRPDESVLKDVKEYAAPAAEYLEQLERENEALRKQAEGSAPAPQQPAFVPDRLPDDIQDDVDSVPELLTWQTTPEGRDNWERAKALDIYLSTLPEWAGKPRTERFQHVVNEVKSKVSAAPSPTTPDPAAVAAAAIAAAPVVAAAPAVTIGDLRGGATPPSNSIPDYHAMAKAGMSDEDIMAKLPQLP